MKDQPKRLLNLRFIKYFFIMLFIFLMIWMMYPIALHGLSSYLRFSTPLAKADAIVVLGGATGERVYYACELYKKGYAPKLIMSGGKLAWELNWSELMQRQALQQGVFEKDILLEEEAASTYENATFVLPIIKKQDFRKIILVTSSYHTRRAYKTFKKVFGDHDIKIMVAPVKSNKHVKFRSLNWWTRHEDAQLVIFEYIKLVAYWFKGYI